MNDLDQIEADLMKTIVNIDGVPEGAYNFRVNGKSISRKSSEKINIQQREDKDGLKITVEEGTRSETIHIPVIISKSGFEETVNNDFYINDNSEITIIAGCGIYNCGTDNSIHSGIHRFFIGKNVKLKYIEKHFGSGPSKGKILLPTTQFFIEEDSNVELELEQIKGVDSSERKTEISLNDRSTITVNEKIFTEGNQKVSSYYNVDLKGIDSCVNITSRSIASDYSQQILKSEIIGRKKCHGHSECNAILIDQGTVSAIPALTASDPEASLIHEAAIGKIAKNQLIKLMTLGLAQKEAESQIINGFMK